MILGAIAGIFVGSISGAVADTEWVSVTDPQEVKELVSGKAIDGGYWTHFYRTDGNMAYYYYLVGNAMTVRKWTIEDDGRLCSAIYSKPDRVIDCYTYQRASDDPTKYHMKGDTGSNVGDFEILDTPPENLVNALNEKAGPMQ
jgi:hypothetical protein